MNRVDITEIFDYLPHRYPFLLVDRVIDYVPHETITAIKNVTYNEPFFTGHFPARPIMPGVLIIEAMAQCCAILVGLSHKEKIKSDRVYLFVGADKVRFKHQVEPGDQLTFKATLLRNKRQIWKAKAEAYVGDKFCSSGELMFAHREVE